MTQKEKKRTKRNERPLKSSRADRWHTATAERVQCHAKIYSEVESAGERGRAAAAAAERKCIIARFSFHFTSIYVCAHTAHSHFNVFCVSGFGSLSRKISFRTWEKISGGGAHTLTYTQPEYRYLRTFSLLKSVLQLQRRRQRRHQQKMKCLKFAFINYKYIIRTGVARDVYVRC